MAESTKNLQESSIAKSNPSFPSSFRRCHWYTDKSGDRYFIPYCYPGAIDGAVACICQRRSRSRIDVLGEEVVCLSARVRVLEGLIAKFIKKH